MAGRLIKLFSLVKSFISTEYLKVNDSYVTSPTSYIFFYAYNKKLWMSE